ncbi:hypothetical protein PA905_32270 [Planktothrix agardhii CCAP 1459/11A]|jgi:hypothetical protein|uniref:Uncharacterized protein n=1 Tax=Planktothrix agardhii CCAP 1459/11A TaxID=282420 RepID=A0A4P5ZFY3_PLAAG|nr:hypothetical protein [Planktothrix agardhii]GDZ95046.1 hypothetical protein PA905_32270 [Planktothrix agardhii CCAP 1459/11A]CAD5938314.1 hypothetical protein NO108_02128 [Planktothrix rubescens]CAH2571664.1 hypothetical protein PRNO82_01063 [Planktothrix rubescens]
MNYKLIDSLVQIISSLTPEERQNLEKKLAIQQLPIQQSSISIKDNLCVGMGKDREDLQNYSEPNAQEWLNAVANNPAFDFLKNPEEDIYTITDGKPFYD